jgi:hypothetical protein
MATDPRIKVTNHGVFKSTGEHIWEMEYFCWTINVRWDGKTPVTWGSLRTSVKHGGDCPGRYRDECRKKGMALAWGVVKKRNANKDQLSLF